MTVERNRAEQVELYGEPLADVFARLTAGLHLSQAGLARAIGMSPPMLSQLGSAHRVKIGNPAVLHRLEALQALLEEVEAGRVGEDELPARIEAVRDSSRTWSTSRLDLAATPAAGTVDRDVVEATTVRQLLRAVASGADLRRAADLLHDDVPGLAELVRTYGLGSPEEAAAHLRRHRELF